MLMLMRLHSFLWLVTSECASDHRLWEPLNFQKTEQPYSCHRWDKHSFGRHIAGSTFVPPRS